MMHEESAIRPGRQARMLAWSALFRRVLHDLNQPLNLIRVIAQDVRLDATKGRLQVETLPQTMREIEQAVSEVATSLARFRVLARAGSTRSREQSFDAQEAAAGAIDRIRRAHPNLSVLTHIPADLPAGRGNSFSFQQALWEVLDNAAQAALQAHAALGRSAGLEVSANKVGENIVFGVRDSGGGVPEEIRGRIFDPFFTTREAADGLGLALSQLLAESIGGNVLLKASDADGSVFELFFPVQASV